MRLSTPRSPTRRNVQRQSDRAGIPVLVTLVCLQLPPQQNELCFGGAWRASPGFVSRCVRVLWYSMMEATQLNKRIGERTRQRRFVIICIRVRCTRVYGIRETRELLVLRISNLSRTLHKGTNDTLVACPARTKTYRGFSTFAVITLSCWLTYSFSLILF
jgi:hypothetical protein